MYNKVFLVIVLVYIFCSMVGVTGNAVAQSKYPERPIQAIVAYAPGGATDSAARIVAESMQKLLKQPVVIMNKPGAGGAIAGNELFRSKADGYTIGMFNSVQIAPEYQMNPERFLYKQKDLQAVAEWSGLCPTIFTRYDAPYKSLEELVKYAKANPDKLKWSHSGKGNRIWMTGILFMRKAGIKMLDVPFQGDAESITALLGNHIDVAVITFGSMTFAQMEAKKIRPLCVTTEERFELLPNVPTLKEFGYGIGLPEAYLGTFVPAGTPAQILAKLSDVTLKATQEPELREKLAKIGMPVWYKNAKDLEQLVDDVAKYQFKTLKELGVL